MLSPGLVQAHAEPELRAVRQNGAHPSRGGARVRGNARMRRPATAVFGEQDWGGSCAAAGTTLLATDGGTSPAVRDSFSGVRDSGFRTHRPAFACPEFAQRDPDLPRICPKTAGHGLSSRPAPDKQKPRQTVGLTGFSMVGVARIELATPAMSTQCSTTELHAHSGEAFRGRVTPTDGRVAQW